MIKPLVLVFLPREKLSHPWDHGKRTSWTAGCGHCEGPSPLRHKPTVWTQPSRLLKGILLAPPPGQLCFTDGSACKEFACNTEDAGSIPGLGRCSGGRNCNPLQYSCHEPRRLVGYSPWGQEGVGHDRERARTQQVVVGREGLTQTLVKGKHPSACIQMGDGKLGNYSWPPVPSLHGK